MKKLLAFTVALGVASAAQALSPIQQQAAGQDLGFVKQESYVQTQRGTRLRVDYVRPEPTQFNQLAPAAGGEAAAPISQNTPLAAQAEILEEQAQDIQNNQ